MARDHCLELQQMMSRRARRHPTHVALRAYIVHLRPTRRVLTGTRCTLFSLSPCRLYGRRAWGSTEEDRLGPIVRPSVGKKGQVRSISGVVIMVGPMDSPVVPLQHL